MITNEDREPTDPEPQPKQAARVTIHYFKPGSGKWNTTDEGVLWPTDPNHFTGYKPFAEVVRIKSAWAVCLETPLGHPVSNPPAWPDHFTNRSTEEVIAIMEGHIQDLQESMAKLLGIITELMATRNNPTLKGS